ncbi:FAD binding domain-containing protein [Aspergillus undulatus]|uniref:FAD binding domain-containing protein n=1 Tax=Aspergillus undulatus TaxID=1810928 RepID=UPI003CCE34FD
MALQTSTTDLLIIGAGPAGLIAACWASSLGLTARIIDENEHRTKTGHADGIHSRTLEIFDSFGIVDPVIRKAVVLVHMSYWGVNPDSKKLECQHRARAQPPGLSRFEQVLLNQGVIEQIMLDYLTDQGRIKIERQKRAKKIYFTDNETHPVYVETKSLRTDRMAQLLKPNPDGLETSTNGDGDAAGTGAGDAQVTEIIQARYVVACDGAKSTVREQLSVPMEAKSTDSKWGVIDIVPITDFPDIRQSCAIHSDQYGSIMTAPRENRLVRFYIQLEGNSDSDLERKALEQSDESPDALIQLIQRILHPYSLTYRYCDWWSIYPIKQGLVGTYQVRNRVFLAGDAAHTHSPKAGQGMNVSIQDTYNLIWKIGSVINGVLDPVILQTYEAERRPVAETMMEMDSDLVHVYEQKEASISDVSKVRESYAGFISGVEVTYASNVLIASGGCDGHNEGEGGTKTLSNSSTIKLGMRLRSVTVVNQADGCLVDLARAMPSNGTWRVLVFAGDLRRRRNGERVAAFAEGLERYPHYTSGAQGRKQLEIEVIMIHAGPRDSVNIMDLPEVFRPFDEELGYDYGKVFADDGTYGRDCGGAYEQCGIDKAVGCLVLCRPDQHVSWIGRLEDVSNLHDHFSGFYRVDSK